MLPDPKPVTVQKRLLRIFRYLEALNQLRNPSVSVIDDQHWVLWLRDLPKHPSAQVGQPPRKTDETVTDRDHVLKVARPTLTPPPEPPEILLEWLERGWEKYPGQLEIREFRNIVANGITTVERFDDDEERSRSLVLWRREREAWLQAEKPARDAMKVFEKLYELFGELEREGERYEVVLGDGILNWRREDGGTSHPILLQRIHFKFDPQGPEFVLNNSDQSPELYSSLFRAMQDVDGRRLAASRDRVEQEWLHPLEEQDTTAFLRYFVQQLAPNAEFLDQAADWRTHRDHPRMWRDPVIFVRQRSLGFASAIETILEDIEKRASFPVSLVNISGAPSTTELDLAQNDLAEPSSSSGGPEMEPIRTQEILFSKPANREQFQIAEKLESSGCVLVQGPPGTGKTHTIANLIGHLLAHGKSVLITSHTTKALRVLRQKVVEKLQPLCVSVLESDSESRKELESAVSGIIHRFANENGYDLQRRANSYRSQRAELYNRLGNTERLLADCVRNEYKDIVVAGVTYRPTDAAQAVRKLSENAWVPSPVLHGAAFPLSEEQLTELYWTSTVVSADDERQLDLPLVDLAEISSPSKFAADVAGLRILSSEALLEDNGLWKSNSLTVEYLKDQASRINDIRKFLEPSNQDAWKLHVVAAGQRGQASSDSWRNLLKMIHRVSQEHDNIQELLYQHGPEVEGELSDDDFAILDQLSAKLAEGGQLSRWALVTHPAWKKLLNRLKIAGRTPQNAFEIQATTRYGRFLRGRKELLDRWNRQLQPVGGPAADNLGADPIAVLRQYAQLMAEAIDWHEKAWKPLIAEIETIIDWPRLVGSQPPVVSPVGDLLRGELALGTLLLLIDRKIQLLTKAKIEADLRDLLYTLERKLGRNSADVIMQMSDAVKLRDGSAYRAAYEKLVSLVQLRDVLSKRRALLGTLMNAAPGLARAIRDRIPPHESGRIPGDFRKAWLWRQLHDELERRNHTSPPALQDQIEKLKVELDHLNADLIDASAWAHQLSRIKREQQQALIGWLDTIKHIGRGTGKRVPRLLREAKELMNQSKSAVPVWIMPLSRVVENFNPARTRFDVLIIDEASQCDILGLIAMYMADQVVVVGDHEQVSPEGVGQKVAEIQHLIDSHLTGIPNAHLYDGRMSVYDLARQSFGGLICLREHFRCVPDIIHFSNGLSYNWQIKPLRDSSDVVLKPHTITVKTDGTRDAGKTNEVEARHVCSLLMSCLEQPAYKGKSLGINFTARRGAGDQDRKDAPISFAAGRFLFAQTPLWKRGTISGR